MITKTWFPRIQDFMCLIKNKWTQNKVFLGLKTKNLYFWDPNNHQTMSRSLVHEKHITSSALIFWHIEQSRGWKKIVLMFSYIVFHFAFFFISCLYYIPSKHKCVQLGYPATHTEFLLWLFPSQLIQILIAITYG